MKKLLLTAMLAALLVMPLEGAALAQTPEASAPTADTAQELDFDPGCVPAETDALESMTPAIHAVVLAMLHQEQTVYSPQNAQLTWEALYNMLSLYGQMDDRSDYVGEDLVLPTEAALDFSTALTLSLDALGPLPEELSDRMVYDAELDSYRLACGSDSLAQIRLDSSRDAGRELELTGTLVYLVDNTDLARFRVTLRSQDNLFGYTVAGLELL
ncbi:hypothetical protein [Pseudoflavonifractor phocaeensis]|uniref:hypothetical protein n=1 Tax=Pseudoflavonifractor phocaeensis TaxID=1870988 RepID=UPI001F230615|nr:hypothetical protein [Pseudoflavonifractor phocaeensis]MCF2596938.1 hypothetical protein [Pseudoflavonifractor phocaeensis]